MEPDRSAPGAFTAPGEQDQRLTAALRHIAQLFPEAVLTEEPQPTLLLPTAVGVRDRFLDLQRRLAPLGLLPLLRALGGRPALLLVPKPSPGQWAWQTNLLLFLATVVTTFLSGYQWSAGLVRDGYLTSELAGGFTFSAAVLFILGSHEMGHKFVAIRRGIDASLPYFLPMIPVPPLPGTMGAVIVTRTPAPNRDSLMDLGASGPIAGFLAAIPVLIYGVMHSFVVKAAQFTGGDVFPAPLFIQWLIRWVLNPPGDAVVLGHPVLFAGWFGLIVTSINLLPAGMLDGGHAVRAALGPRLHRILSFVGVGLAAAMGFLPMALLILLLMRRGHPGPLDDVSPLSLSRRIIGLSLIGIFILSAVSLFR